MKPISAVLGLALALAVGAPAFAATNVIVNVTGNNNSDPCNSTLIGKNSGFEITSYAIGGTNPVNAGSQGSGVGVSKPTLQPLVIAKAFDSCSGELTKLLLTGKVIPTVTLYDYKTTNNAPGFDFLTITLSEAFITSYQLSDPATGKAPTETLSIVYGKVCITNTPQTATGAAGTSTTVCYNGTTNVPS